METQKTKEIYSSMKKVWPDNNIWYSYLQTQIVKYIELNLAPALSENDIYLNAGSGGSTYNLPGTCYHVDIASNLIQNIPNSFIASIEKMPFSSSVFDAIICVGSVINYCSALESLAEFSRTIKKGGILILEFERSQSAELWLTKDFGKNATLQQYDYLGNIHTLWLYSESYISNLLVQNYFKIINKSRIHSMSAILNKITHNEHYAGKFGRFDNLMRPISYITAHNVIMICQKI